MKSPIYLVVLTSGVSFLTSDLTLPTLKQKESVFPLRSKLAARALRRSYQGKGKALVCSNLKFAEKRL